MTYLEIEGRNCTVTLQARPFYCDRGHFIAKVHNNKPEHLHIDAADCWPRYYFFESLAQIEVEAWLRARGELLTTDWHERSIQ